MQRRQEELAGGPCEPVAGLAAASRAICAAARRQDDEDRPYTDPDEPEQTIVCPEHGYRHTYGTSGEKRTDVR
jgi:hypothetical protein